MFQEMKTFGHGGVRDGAGAKPELSESGERLEVHLVSVYPEQVKEAKHFFPRLSFAAVVRLALDALFRHVDDKSSE